MLGNDTDANDDTLTVTGNTDPRTAPRPATRPAPARTRRTPATSAPTASTTPCRTERRRTPAPSTSRSRLRALPPCASTTARSCSPCSREGDLNSSDGTGSVAGRGRRRPRLRFPRGNDATSPGCLCEGWGAPTPARRHRLRERLERRRRQRMTVESFTLHGVHRRLGREHPEHVPAGDAELPPVAADAEPLRGHGHDREHQRRTPLADIRYRRVMDWDIEPTAFSEYVTIERRQRVASSSSTATTASQTANPLGPRTRPSGAHRRLHGRTARPTTARSSTSASALSRPARARRSTSTTAPPATETDALTAVNAVGAEVYSLGQPSTPDGPTLGTPNTFIFAFAGVGGAAIFSPNAADDTLTNAGEHGGIRERARERHRPERRHAHRHDARTAARTAPSRARPPGLCTYTPGAGYVGADAFDYAVSDGHGGTDTATVHVTVTAVNHAPAASDVSVATDQDTPHRRDARRDDADGDALDLRRHGRPRARDAQRQRREPHVHARRRLLRRRLLHVHRERRQGQARTPRP